MAVKVDWYLKGYVLYIEYSGVMGKNDIHQSYTLVQSMSDEHRANQIQSIINSYGIERYDFGLKDVSSLLQARQGNGGWTLNVVPTSNPMVKLMTNMFASFAAQFVGFRYRSFSTMDEAVAFLKDQDDQIAALLD